MYHKYLHHRKSNMKKLYESPALIVYKIDTDRQTIIVRFARDSRAKPINAARRSDKTWLISVSRLQGTSDGYPIYPQNGVDTADAIMTMVNEVYREYRASSKGFLMHVFTTAQENLYRFIVRLSRGSMLTPTIHRVDESTGKLLNNAVMTFHPRAVNLPRGQSPLNWFTVDLEKLADTPMKPRTVPGIRSADDAIIKAPTQVISNRVDVKPMKIEVATYDDQKHRRRLGQLVAPVRELRELGIPDELTSNYDSAVFEFSDILSGRGEYNPAMFTTVCNNMISSYDDIVSYLNDPDMSDDYIAEVMSQLVAMPDTILDAVEALHGDVLTPWYDNLKLGDVGLDGIPEAQRATLAGYTSDEYESINQYLLGRGGESDVAPRLVENMDGLFRRSGARLGEILPGAQLWRMMEFSSHSEVAPFLKQTTFTNDAFMSTSLSPKIMTFGCNVDEYPEEHPRSTSSRRKAAYMRALPRPQALMMALGRNGTMTRTSEVLEYLNNNSDVTVIVMFVINSSEAGAIIPDGLSERKEECEVILNRGSTFDMYFNSATIVDGGEDERSQLILYMTLTDPIIQESAVGVTVKDGSSLLAMPRLFRTMVEAGRREVVSKRFKAEPKQAQQIRAKFYSKLIR
ncbi:Alt-like RNA polymerase ADP-ribosyltransferase [Vibrio phage EniLVp02]